MEMVASYRDIEPDQGPERTLAPIKDALTRHLIAGDEDKIELADGSYMVSKVMTAHWVYPTSWRRSAQDRGAAHRPQSCREEGATQRQGLHLHCTRQGQMISNTNSLQSHRLNLAVCVSNWMMLA